MKRAVGFLFIALFAFNGYLWAGGDSDSAGMARKAGNGESEIIIQRAEMPVHSGFKEHVYIDGTRKLVLANGESGKIIVPDGDHVIHAELYTLTTAKVPFSAKSNAVKFTITPYSLQDFAIEKTDEDKTSEDKIDTNSPQYSANSAINDDSVEGSLLRASGQIMAKIPSRSRIAIVYVTSKDAEITDYIAEELEFIMVGQGLTLIDRSQLDNIRREQNFQLSGEVDDAQAVSIGKIAGADIIITGAVTGTGNLRRLRLRALNTQTAQVLAAASERY
jgi:hypothetical protein